MDEQAAFTGDDDSSDNDSCSSYDILHVEDFDNNEHGTNSENISGVYFVFIFQFAKYDKANYFSMFTNLQEDVDVDNVQNSFQESFADNLSQVRSYMLYIAQQHVVFLYVYK